MQLFFGFVGIINILSLFPLVLILHFTGYEQLELPSTGKAWVAVLVNVRSFLLRSGHIYRCYVLS